MDKIWDKSWNKYDDDELEEKFKDFDGLKGKKRFRNLKNHYYPQERVGIFIVGNL